jgi:gold/copper resistance efflux system membrane fusion protein
MGKKSNIIAAALILPLAAGAVLALRSTPNEAQARAAAPQPGPPEVPVAEVVIRPIADSVELTGKLQAAERVELRARVDGLLERIAFTEGALVDRGQILFEIDARPFRATLARAAADLRQAEERLALAGLEHGRAKKLHAENVIPAAELDRLAAAHAEARARVAAGRATVRAASLDVEHTKVRAPIAGRVGQALVTRGNLVSGGAGATLLTTIVSVDPMHVEFDVDEPTYVRLTTGRSGASPVQIALDGDEGRARAASLDFIGNQLDPGSGTARARATLPNRDGSLRPGLFARIRLESTAPRDTVLVRDQAIGTDQSGRYVLVVSPEGTLSARPVELGGIADGLRVVRRGLAAGDRVVLGGLVRPGMTVAPKLTPMIPTTQALVQP